MKPKRTNRNPERGLAFDDLVRSSGGSQLAVSYRPIIYATVVSNIDRTPLPEEFISHPRIQHPIVELYGGEGDHALRGDDVSLAKAAARAIVLTSAGIPWGVREITVYPSEAEEPFSISIPPDNPEVLFRTMSELVIDSERPGKNIKSSKELTHLLRELRVLAYLDELAASAVNDRKSYENVHDNLLRTIELGGETDRRIIEQVNDLSILRGGVVRVPNIGDKQELHKLLNAISHALDGSFYYELDRRKTKAFLFDSATGYSIATQRRSDFTPRRIVGRGWKTKELIRSVKGHLVDDVTGSMRSRAELSKVEAREGLELARTAFAGSDIMDRVGIAEALMNQQPDVVWPTYSNTV